MASPNDAPKAVLVRDLERHFGAFRAVDRVSFSVAQGEIFGFLGPNGAGKSTTIKMLMGMLSITSGEARVLGLDVTQDPIGVKQRVGPGGPLIEGDFLYLLGKDGTLLAYYLKS